MVKFYGRARECLVFLSMYPLVQLSSRGHFAFECLVLFYFVVATGPSFLRAREGLIQLSNGSRECLFSFLFSFIRQIFLVLVSTAP
jgi:hypothetical protein